MPTDGQPSERHDAAAALLAAQHDDVVDALASVHPAMSDARRPLLTHNLAALPSILHAAACRRVVRASGGAAKVSLCDAATLRAALLALQDVPQLADLTVCREPCAPQPWRHRDHARLEKQQIEAACMAAPHLEALTRLTHVRLDSTPVHATSALVAVFAALPAHASVTLGYIHAASDSPSTAAALCEGVAACAALTSLDLSGVSDGEGALGGLAPLLVRLPRLAALGLWSTWPPEASALPHVASVARLAHLVSEARPSASDLAPTSPRSRPSRASCSASPRTGRATSCARACACRF
jgi:hypothetical protein